MSKYDKEIKEIQQLALEVKNSFPITERKEKTIIKYGFGSLDMSIAQVILSLRIQRTMQLLTWTNIALTIALIVISIILLFKI